MRIVHLDEHLVVVQKPAGVTTLRHREETDLPQRRKQLQPTLDELLPRRAGRTTRSFSEPNAEHASASEGVPASAEPPSGVTERRSRCRSAPSIGSTAIRAA